MHSNTVIQLCVLFGQIIHRVNSCELLKCVWKRTKREEQKKQKIARSLKGGGRMRGTEGTELPVLIIFGLEINARKQYHANAEMN